MTFAPQKTLCGFLVMIYDRVCDGHKVSCKNFGLGRPFFYTTDTLKLKLQNVAHKR